MPDAFQQSVDANQNADTRLILERFNNLTNEVRQNRAETREVFSGLRDEMREGVRRIELRLDSHDERIRRLELTQTDLSARVTMSGILQTGFATVAAAIAAVVGAIFK